MLELYHSINSVCAQKVRIALAEKGLAYETVTIDLSNRPAWLYELTSFGGQGNSRYAVRFTKLAALEVEDGFNEITILVTNPDGPLPVANEAHALERLARTLAPRFYYA